MKQTAILEFYQGNLKFSAGHFTIFSATQRERLHGHNYYLEASLTAAIGEPGITFDYALSKAKLEVLCCELHSRFLLPGQSPYLKIVDDGDYVFAEFNRKKIPFLKEDVLIMPLSNITLEELSRWFVNRIVTDDDFLVSHHISKILIKVFNGPGQSALAQWEKQHRFC